MTSSAPHNTQVAVIGGGPVGLAIASGLAQAGVETALIARKTPYADNRTTALLGASVDHLLSLGVWDRCKDQAARLQVMRLIDDTARLIRAPEVRFSSDEIGHEAFGYNIENHRLVDALEARAAELAHLTRFDSDAADVIPATSNVSIITGDGGQIDAALAIGADGRNSLARQSAGITVKDRTLAQSAVTFNVTHARPHKNISTEFHTADGPCVFVPLPGHRSSIVWVTTPEQAQALAAMNDDDLGAAAERQAHSVLGAMRPEGSRHVFALSIQTPSSLAANRVALAGEAAHVLPPIGAQGLNLGLRDAADLVRIVVDAHAQQKDLGGDDVLSRYASARRADIFSRTAAIDLANRSLLSDLLPAQSLRAVGMHLLATPGPIRRFAMREGLAPWWRSAS